MTNRAYVLGDRIWIGLDKRDSSNWEWLDGTVYTLDPDDFMLHDQQNSGNNCINLVLSDPANDNFAKFDDNNCPNVKYGLCQFTN